MDIELNFPNPVETLADLFDRKEELNQIQQEIESPIRRPIVIIGERRTGKTSILNVAAENLTQTQLATVLDIPHAYSREGLAAEILEGICIKVGSDTHQTGLVNNQGQFS